MWDTAISSNKIQFTNTHIKINPWQNDQNDQDNYFQQQKLNPHVALMNTAIA